MTELHDDWREFLRLLIAHRVKFLVVGAHALAAHGRPRFTGDLDVFVEPSVPNARRILAALDEFGFGAVNVTVDDLTSPTRVIQLGQPPVRIDLLPGISGVSFDRAWRGRMRGVVAGLRVNFIGRAEYLANKRAADRPKDRADLALLSEGGPKKRKRKQR